jgi:hypothetical protein
LDLLNNQEPPKELIFYMGGKAYLANADGCDVLEGGEEMFRVVFGDGIVDLCGVDDDAVSDNQ